MSASKLIKPSVDQKESFIEAIKEFQEEGRFAFLDINEIEKNFEKFINDINEGKRHMHKPYENWVEPVPETILWMVKGDQYIGSLNIRHRLNWHLEKWGGHVNFMVRPSMRRKGFGKKILQKGIPCLCYLGIERALVTIPPKNTAAQHIVEINGGKFEDETSQTDQFPARRRYWIECQ